MNSVKKLLLLTLSVFLITPVSRATEPTKPKAEKKPKFEVETNKAAAIALSTSSQQQLNDKLHQQLTEALALNPNLSSSASFVDNMSDVKENVSIAMAEARFDAQATFDFLDQGSGGGYKTEFDYESLIQLPVGVKKKLGDGTDAAIGIHSVQFFKDHAEVTLFVRLVMKNPNNPTMPERLLYFGARNIHFTKNGGLSGSFEAALLGDFIIEMGKWTVKLKGNDEIINATIPTTGFSCNPGGAGAYCRVKIGCGQFERATLAAEVIFPTSVLKPFDKSTGKTSAGRVTGGLVAEVGTGLEGSSTGGGGLNDLIACITFDKPFAIPTNENFGFELQNIYYDMSDTRNPVGVNLVNNQGANIAETATSTWRGFYAQNIGVLLPQQFRTDNSEMDHESISLSAKNLMIDQSGVTGTLAYDKIAGEKELNASGWGFSIKEFSVSLVSNSIQGGSFQGLIQVPIFSNGSSRFAFTGSFNRNEQYSMSLGYLTNVESNAMRGRLNITKSEISFVYLVGSKKFLPSASFSGTVNIISDVNDISETTPIPAIATTETIRFKGIVFENLKLATVAPRLTIGSCRYENATNEFANYPVKIEELSFTVNGYNNPSVEAGALNIRISLNLLKMNEQDNTSKKGFSLVAQIKIPFKEKNTALVKYIPSKVEFVGGGVDAVVAGCRISAQMYYDDIPGRKKEFRGEVGIFGIKDMASDMNTTVGNGARIALVAGHTYGQDKFRYFYVDGMVSFPIGGIPIGPGVMINAMGLTLHNHVKPKTKTIRPEGASFLDYEEDKNAKFGLKVMLGLIVGDKNVVSAKIFYEQSPSEDMVIGKIGLWGVASIGWDVIGSLGFGEDYFKAVNSLVSNASTAVKEATNSNMLAKSTSSLGNNVFNLNGTPVQLRVGAIWDRAGKTFYASNLTYINLGIIKGAGQNGRAGGSEFYINNTTNEWFINTGSPLNPNGVKVGFGWGISFGAKYYALIGNVFPSSLPPPRAVIDALGLQVSDYELSEGQKSTISNGFAFASGISMFFNNNLDLYFAYTKFSVETGVNFMVTPKLKACEVSEFYGRGRVYAAVSIITGKRNLYGKKTEISNVSGAAMLSGGMMNPFYISGQVGLHTKLAGKVNKTKIKTISTGTECL